ncbi:MAG: cytochrome c-type biogenesis protein CcmH [Gemmatimonadota bacterium]|uniref:cytochrome c-type biogenesis protein n=1 Tax=Candidatus Palauibacter scopulicola TaxID=3056741 RepID=UPI0023838CA4|nr:cytochrome c-type biogenesis protein [Candidatus Palauibacter scopulicola]MDE2662115.1 cytochrome c-type biogenesis protein CcmH [Candidatus Palauibacter scopulicola]
MRFHSRSGARGAWGGAFLATVLLAAPAAAQTVDGALDGVERPAAPGDAVHSAEIDQQTAEIGATLRCPICRQQSVAESSSRIAREMQDVIRTMLAEGRTPEEIEAYFVDAYGPWVLLKPRAEGMNLFVYAGPGLAFLLGGFIVARRIRRGRSRDEEGRDEPETPDHLRKADRRWLEAAIKGS